MSELSPTMQKCVAFMKEHGDQIHRHPGGFWSDAGFTQSRGGVWFGTSTVAALVKRRHVEYDKYVGTNPFPVRATLLQPPTADTTQENP